MGTFGRTTLAPDPLPPAPAPSTPLPAGFILVADRDLWSLAEGRVLVGGSPGRVLRLRPRAARMAGRWLDGEPVGSPRAAQRVARRLTAGGLVHPRPQRTPLGGSVTVVVPVRDRPLLLARLLASLGPIPCVVVDDASADRVGVEKVARESGADYVRLDVHSGAAAARNAGVARVRTPLVAFVDSDCVVPAGWLEDLCGHFADPLVALVAPRVTTPPGTSALARYESARSSLDLGPEPGRVAPGNRISYVPTAAVVARRAALGSRCFDERLAAGEDVDLVWRLVAAGWEVRYEPVVEVCHGEDPRLGGWLARRALYGSTAGPLARRHPKAVAPARVPLSFLLGWVLLAGRRPVGAAAVTAASSALLAGRLSGVVDEPFTLATRLTVAGTARAAAPTVAGLARVWSPALLGTLLLRRQRRLRLAAAGALAVSVGTGWRSRPDGLDPVRYTGLRLCDDLAYGAGVWWGCAAARTVRPLLPVVTGLPWSSRRALPRPAGRGLRGRRRDAG